MHSTEADHFLQKCATESGVHDEATCKQWLLKKAGHKTNCQDDISHVITSMDLCLLKLFSNPDFCGTLTFDFLRIKAKELDSLRCYATLCYKWQGTF